MSSRKESEKIASFVKKLRQILDVVLCEFRIILWKNVFVGTKREILFEFPILQSLLIKFCPDISSTITLLPLSDS